MARDAVNKYLLSCSVIFSKKYEISKVFGSTFKHVLTSHVVVISKKDISGEESFLVGLGLC